MAVDTPRLTENGLEAQKAKQDRLAASLRENLKRRKQQGRLREEAEAEPAADKTPL